MRTGAITGYFDVAQIVLYAFWIFFAGLIIYLRREDKREGYPLESDRSQGSTRVRVQGWPAMPSPKTFKLAHGASVMAPSDKRDMRTIQARPTGPWLGAPLEPTGNPMIDGVGPAAYAERSEEPDRTLDGQPMIVPMRVAPGFGIASRDPDPRGMPVYGADRSSAGVVRDVWVDRTEPQIRYLEVETPTASGPRRVMLPITFARIDALRGRVLVKALLARHFADVPVLRNPDQISLREEDRISAYYAGGKLYAEPSRLGPYL